MVMEVIAGGDTAAILTTGDGEGTVLFTRLITVIIVQGPFAEDGRSFRVNPIEKLFAALMCVGSHFCRKAFTKYLSSDRRLNS